jgi:hypothetical protein
MSTAASLRTRRGDLARDLEAVNLGGAEDRVLDRETALVHAADLSDRQAAIQTD